MAKEAKGTKAAVPKPKKAATPKPKKAAAPKPPKQEAAKTAPPAKRDPSLGPVVKTRIVFPKDYYEPNKDEIKAPFKAHGLKWNYLGEGKGLYKKDKEVHCFAQFLDDGTHYSIWGDDKAAVEEILKAWRVLAGEALYAKFTSAGEAATETEAAVKESEELRLWKLGEPQPRPGEPEFFLKKRRDEWLAKKPSS